MKPNSSIISHALEYLKEQKEAHGKMFVRSKIKSTQEEDNHTVDGQNEQVDSVNIENSPEAANLVVVSNTEQFDLAKIEGTLEGQIAAFGGNVVQSGLLPALLFYQQKRQEVYKALDEIHKRQFGQRGIDLVELAKSKTGSQDDYNLVRSQVMQCAVGLKLAMRTYAFTPKGQNTEA